VKPVTIAKVALALSGLATFGIGIRFNNAMFRWTGIGLVAVAWMLRFVKDQETH
jgi:hypothetical protein